MNGHDEESNGASETESLLKRPLLVESDQKDSAISDDDTSTTTATTGGGGGHRRGHSLFSFLHEQRNGGDRRKSYHQHHHRRTSSISRLFTSVSEGLGTIREDVKGAASEVRGAFLQELHEADQGDRYFLDMSMTRSLSVLPEALVEFVEEATGVDLEAKKKEEEEGEKGFPMGPFLSLLGAVMAISSNGTALSLLKGVAPPLKVYWRMTATASFLAIFALRTMYKEEGGIPRLNSGQWTTFGMAVFCFVMQCLCFVTALEFTSIGNAVIYANSQALLLLMGKALVGEPVLCMESSGALVAFAGAILCSRDSEGSARVDPEKDSSALIGDVLAMCSALGGVGYLTFGKAVRPHMTVTVFMFLVMFTGSFLVLAFMAIINVQFDFSGNPDHGLFGWAAWRSDRLLIAVWIVVVCNVVGSMGFVRAMQHFDNLIIAVATLLEPMVASFIAYELRVGVLPGPLGWLGNFMVAIGTLGVVYPSVNKGGAH